MIEFVCFIVWVYVWILRCLPIFALGLKKNYVLAAATTNNHIIFDPLNTTGHNQKMKKNPVKNPVARKKKMKPLPPPVAKCYVPWEGENNYVHHLLNQQQQRRERVIRIVLLHPHTNSLHSRWWEGGVGSNLVRVWGNS